MADSNTKTTVTLEVNGTQAQSTLDGLRKIAEQTRQAMDKAAAAGDRITLQKLRKELNRTEKSIKDMESTGAHLQKVMANLGKASPNELQRTLTILKKQLNYIERGSKEWDEQVAKIKKVKAEIHTMNASMSESRSLGTKITDVFNRWISTVGAAALSITGVVQAGRKAVQTYADMDEQMANTRKYTGMTREEVAKLNESFRNMNTRTSRAELNELAQEAGRLGKTTMEDVQGYVEAADIINVALVDLGEGATQQIAKLANIFGVEKAMGTKDAMLAIGSTVNVLSQNCTASKPYLVEFTQRMAGIGAQAKMTVPELVAFGAVLDANGQRSEMSASALGRLTMMLFNDPAEMAKKVGLSVDEFTKTLKRSTTEGVVMFLEKVNELGGEGGMAVLAPLFKDLGADGVRMSQVLATLATHVDEVNWQIGNANKAFKEATSATREFNIFNNTTQANLDKAKKRLQEVAVQVGEKLVPVMSHVITKTRAILEVFSAIIDVLSEHKTAVLATVAAITAYTVALKAETLAKKAYSAVTAAATAIQRGFNTAVKDNAIGLAVAAITAAIVAFKEYADSINKAKKELDYMGKAEKSIQEQYTKKEAKMKVLLEQANNENLSLKTRKRSIEELNKIVPGYNAYIVETTGKIVANNEAMEKYLVNLKRQITMQAYAINMQKAMNKQVELESKKAKLKAEGASTDDIKEVDEQIKKVQHDYEFFERNLESYNERTKEIAQSQYNEIAKSYNMQFSILNDYVKSGEITQEQYMSRRKRTFLNYLKEIKNIANIDPAIIKKAEEQYERLFGETKGKKKGESKSTNASTSATSTASSRSEENQELKRLKEARKKEEVELLASYARRKVSKEEYERSMVAIEKKYYKDALKIQTLSGEERQELTRQQAVFWIRQNEEYDKKMEDKRREAEERRKKQEEEYAREKSAIREYLHDVFSFGTDEDKAEYEEQLSLFERAKADMLIAAGNDNKKRLEIEEASEIAILELKKKYFQITNEEYEKALGKRTNLLVEWLETDEGQAVMQSYDTIVQGMSDIFSQIQDLIDAEVEQHTAAIETEYDAMISAAEGNKYKETQLEKEKEAKIAEMKNEASEKAYTMEVISATAQGAMAAVNAYASAAAIPVTGYIMAPIAAAMALAATGLQIANLKKQKEIAASSGYAEGGFTRAGKKYEVAGVVHAGEWVASQELVNSPVARPIINSLEQAQRTNSIASLNSRDVSESITAPITLARAAKNSGQSSDNVASTLSALNKRLNEPFVTVNTVSGDNGINKAMRRYEKLKSNK